MHKLIKFSDSISLNRFLKKKLKKGQKVFRYIFHENDNDKDQLMMIWQKKKLLLSSKKIFRYAKDLFFN